MSKTLLDIGACYGAYTQRFAPYFDRVVMVEANPTLAQQLIKKFTGDKFVVVSALASYDNTPKDFYIASTETLSTASKRWITNSRFISYNSWDKKIITASVTVDHLMTLYPDISYIKIDVEGYELEVLRGMSVKYSPLSFEWTEELSDSAIECVKYLAKLGYTKFCVEHGDNYEYMPNRNFLCSERVITSFETIHSDKLWGMIHAK